MKEKLTYLVLFFSLYLFKNVNGQVLSDTLTSSAPSGTVELHLIETTDGQFTSSEH